MCQPNKEAMKAPDQASIQRTLENRATKQEARTVLEWLKTEKGKKFLAQQIETDMENYTPDKKEEWLDHAIPKEEMYQFLLHKIRKQRRRKILFRVAAIFIPLLLITTQFYYLNRKVDLFGSAEYEDVFVPHGERMRIVFQDGSHVILNAGSHIKYPRKFAFSDRTIELTGEGFFLVNSNSERPFIVDVGSLQIKVTGTSFDVKAYPEDTEIQIALETGQVSLFRGSNALTTLKPGERASYNRNTGICNISREKEITRHSAWKENILILENSPLPEVLTTLSRWYNIEFSVQEQEVLDYNYTLTTQKLKLEEILKELEKIAPVRFIQDGDIITVQMKK